MCVVNFDVNVSLLAVGYTVRKWMAKDLGEGSPGFEEKYRARCREIGSLMRTIIQQGAQADEGWQKCNV